ncbi:MAG: PTS fructose transporter subunit IIB [Chloroflexi bacterium]|jgi:fructose-specific phosphotransferase system IIB component|nr:PTS fructose transporter subunit IIB [Anaerolineaceae bacterium]NMB87651.1 PTS fructose transporter subunit IIB [Chloroflexota bacterium]
MKIIGVTACAGGIAHTYMAAEAIKKSARKAGDEAKVEIQGSMGLENKLSAADIAAADLVLIVANIAVRGLERFKGKKVVEIDPGKFVSDADASLLLAKKKGGLV